MKPLITPWVRSVTKKWRGEIEKSRDWRENRWKKNNIRDKSRRGK